MKVTICKDELTAKDEAGNVYKINGVSIRKDPPKEAVFYDMSTTFAKCCCAFNTPHNAVEISEGLINLL